MSADYDRGVQCEWMGERVVDMSRERLVEFIGQLDTMLEVERNKQ